MLNRKENRISRIDAIKGLGIVLVIAGHIYRSDLIVGIWIFSFHMPLFFFLSGYLLHYGRDLRDFIKRKVNSLLLPFIMFALIGLIVSCIIPVWRNGITYDVAFKQLYLGRLEFLHVGQIWFLLCLFEVEVVFYAMYSLIKGWKCIFKPMMLIGGVMAYFMGYHIKTISQFFLYGFLPLTIDSACMAMFFFMLGVCVRYYDERECFFCISPITTIVILIVTLLSVESNGFVNISALEYHDAIKYLIFSVLGIYACCGIGKMVESFGFIKYIGRNSLFIFGIHSFPIYLYDYILSEVFSCDVIHAYNISNEWAFIGSVFVLICSVALCEIFTKLKKSILRE